MAKKIETCVKASSGTEDWGSFKSQNFYIVIYGLKSLKILIAELAMGTKVLKMMYERENQKKLY